MFYYVFGQCRDQATILPVYIIIVEGFADCYTHDVTCNRETLKKTVNKPKSDTRASCVYLCCTKICKIALASALLSRDVACAPYVQSSLGQSGPRSPLSPANEK